MLWRGYRQTPHGGAATGRLGRGAGHMLGVLGNASISTLEVPLSMAVM
jgi:hypothetical protein